MNKASNNNSPDTIIYFIRHGLVHNPDDIYYGRLPGFVLSDEGKAQAAALMAAMPNPWLAAVYTSPMLRARQTAEILAQSYPNLPVQISPLLNEVHSPYDGLLRTDLAKRNWDLYAGAGQDFEQPADVLARVRQFVQEVRNQHAGEAVAAVTHGDLITFLILWINNLPLTVESKSRLPRFGIEDGYPAPTSITEVVYSSDDAGGRPAMRYIAPLPHNQKNEYL